MADHGDPIISNRFFLILPGEEKIGSIQEVSGLEDESEVSELMQVAKGGKVVQIKTLGANPLKAGTITVKYAAFKDDPAKKWFDEVVQNKVKDMRKTISIQLYEIGKTEPTLTFDFTHAWPNKYSFSSLTSKGSDPTAITLTLQHEGMSVKGYNAS